MEEWVKDINSWDVCDQVCMNLFEKTPLAWKKILDWSERDEEFVKRTAYALIACLAWHGKELDDQKFIDCLPIIKRGSTDDRNFLKKAVSWALRNIGKRNPYLRQSGLDLAAMLLREKSKSARWIGRDAMRDLNSESTRRRMEKLKSQGR